MWGVAGPQNQQQAPGVGAGPVLNQQTMGTQSMNFGATAVPLGLGTPPVPLGRPPPPPTAMFTTQQVLQQAQQPKLQHQLTQQQQQQQQQKVPVVTQQSR